MKTLRLIVAFGALATSIAVLPAPVLAATAHNSQAGGLGNSNNAAGPSGMTMRKKQMSHRRMMHRKSM